MKALKVVLFVLMNIANYVLVLLGVLLYRWGSPLLYPLFLLLQPALVLANYFVSTKIWQLSVLSVHLLISTIIANLLSTHLYAINIAAGETYTVGKAAAIIGCAYVIGLSIAAIIIKREHIKKLSPNNKL